MKILAQLLIALLVFIGSVVLCATGGGLIGRFIAHQYPSYYPSVFSSASTRPYFDPVQVGIGTGIGQGAAAGLWVGAIVVLALAIANRRRDGRSGQPPAALDRDCGSLT
jgi:hypothetical protein